MTEIDRILLLMAHPDDPEYGCAPAVAHWVDQGIEVRYVLACRGEAGENAPENVPWQTARIRSAEQIEAARAVGVNTVEFLDFPDGRIMYGDPLRLAFARVIRRFRPRVIVTLNFDVFWPWGRSPNQADHRHVGLAVLDAARDAANRWIYQELLLEGLEPWEGARHVYVCGTGQSDLVVPVTDEDVRKGIAALQAHRSYIQPDDAEAYVRRMVQHSAAGSPGGQGVALTVLNL